MFCRIKDFRRIATRYDKRADTFLSTVMLAAALTWWTDSVRTLEHDEFRLKRDLNFSLAPLAGRGGRMLTLSSRLLLQRRPGEPRIILQHQPVDIGGEILEPFCALRSLNAKNRVKIPASAPKAVASVLQGLSPIR